MARFRTKNYSEIRNDAAVKAQVFNQYESPFPVISVRLETLVLYPDQRRFSLYQHIIADYVQGKIQGDCGESKRITLSRFLYVEINLNHSIPCCVLL